MNLDQINALREATKTLALVLVNYKIELESLGLTEEQAMQIVVSYQQAVLSITFIEGI